ncbi:hypothetical protein SAMN05216576_107192 [Ectopseudomonas chengduensis]|jgi:hypothetical protein|uniref:Uncharacterized protein n=1 Tax=Ectopseudomonas chengduensis TaxID=489632 RepID=A0A1G6Q0M3_9GAMM|nr:MULTISPECIES: hypothetical protein [Pseudomonas]OEO24442.1 hypothetical protein AX279_17385 [Pseudomonas sp. J237]SDC85903.1 hypothetical protein SAMN05216576_107192 [Pseudomonas chengduensis]
MTNSTDQQPQVPRAIIVDEFSCYMGGRNDDLKVKLREIEGIPNAAYLVNGTKVFVFEKLVALVTERQVKQPGQTVDEVALELYPDAHVTALEAVNEWDIVPEPYELCDDIDGGIAIRHRPFNAQLPGTYPCQAEARIALARLLLGEVILGKGDFTFCGQPMTLNEPMLALEKLPPRPEIDTNLEPASFAYKALGQVTYENGFEPISEDLFNQVKELETTWKDQSARAEKYAISHATGLWHLTDSLRLEQLIDSRDEVPEYGQEDAAELRTLYPELHVLPDASLYEWFDTYQVECCYLNGWTPYRDDNFLFYMIGRATSSCVDREDATELGQWVGYALLHHNASTDDAQSFGRAALLYDSSITGLAVRVAEAMRYLAKARELTDLRGAPIQTMMDFMKIGRKIGVNQHMAVQNICDLNDEILPVSRAGFD